MINWPDLERRNAPLGAFVDWDRGAAPGDGPLADLSIGIKSNIAVAGLPWTAGMATRRAAIAEADAAVVAKLRSAGATILGTLNMHEAALGATTDNRWYGRTHNPHRPGHTPGGSSGGSGAAVAASLCDAALGTDTLGSIRIPAAYNGVYGLKPTLRAVAEDGLVALEPAFDVIGPLARTLPVLERLWAVIGPAPRSDRERGFARFLLLDDLADIVVEPGVRAGYERALAAFDLPHAALVLPATPTAIRRAALAQVGRTLAAELGAERRGDRLSAELNFILGAAEAIVPDPALLAAVRDRLAEALADDGVLLTPTAPQAAFAHDTRPPANQADFTTLASIAGLPALAVPAGQDDAGLPVGIQLVGPTGSENRLLALAARLEPALGGAVLPPT